ncbi:MAG: hypothetical protein AAFY60_20965, partial [Myxococcota bacterium]
LDAVSGPYTARVFQSETFSSGLQLDDYWLLIDRTDNPLVIEVDGSAVDDTECMIEGEVVGSSDQGLDLTVFGIRQVRGTVSGSSFSVPHEPTPSPAGLYVFETEGTLPATRFNAFGQSRVQIGTLGSGCGASSACVALSPVAETRVTGSITRSAEFATANLVVALSMNFPDASPSFFGPELTEDRYDRVAPAVSGAEKVIRVFADSDPLEVDPVVVFGPSARATYRANDWPSSPVDLELGSPVSVLAPADGATVTLDQIFDWEVSSDADRYELSATCRVEEAGETRRLVNIRRIETNTPGATLPDFPDSPLEDGAVCVWQVGVREFDGAIERLTFSADRVATVSVP